MVSGREIEVERKCNASGEREWPAIWGTSRTKSLLLLFFRKEETSLTNSMDCVTASKAFVSGVGV
jgi:hypothetical protein